MCKNKMRKKEEEKKGTRMAKIKHTELAPYICWDRKNIMKQNQIWGNYI
jgi:hypothetical protein